MATIAEGFDRGSLLHWGFSAFMVLAGLFFMRLGYKFIVVGPVLKTVLGTFSLRGTSRRGLLARALFVCALGFGGVVMGLVIISDMLYGWP